LLSPHLPKGICRPAAEIDVSHHGCRKSLMNYFNAMQAIIDSVNGKAAYS
jgi:hypothetical protein